VEKLCMSLVKLLTRLFKRPPNVRIALEASPLPAGYKLAPKLPDGLFARGGDWIICDGPGEHAIAYFTRDVRIGEMQEPNALRFYQQRPPLGTAPDACRCERCGARWFAGNGHYHFVDGWR
jgi:hypothetical protein